MNLALGRLACVIVVGAGLGVATLASPAAEAGVIHPSAGFGPLISTATGVRCDRSFSNLWSCNDEVRPSGQRMTQRRQTDSYHPCDHSYQTARDGSHCGNRAADKRRGGL